jgi:hypothetical protein
MPDPDSVIVDSADQPFLHHEMRARGAQVADSFGRTDVAQVLRTACYPEILATIRALPPDVQAGGVAEFMATFPNGQQLGDCVELLNNVDFASPRGDLSVAGLVIEHLEGRGLAARPVRTVSTAAAADATGLDEFLSGLTALWDNTDSWSMAAQSQRRMACMMAGELLESATLHALSMAASHFGESAIKSLRLKFAETAQYAATHLVLADLLPFPNASVPFLKTLAAGAVPLGLRDGDVFDVIAS